MSKIGTLRALAVGQLFCAFSLNACGGEQPGGDLGGGPGTSGAGSHTTAGSNSGGASSTAGGVPGAAAGLPGVGGSFIAQGGTTNGGSSSAGSSSGGATDGGTANGGTANGGTANGGTANGGTGNPNTGGDGPVKGIDGPMAYGITIAPNGTWMGIGDPATEVAAIQASGAKYVRFSRAMGNDQVGIPNAENAPYARQLIKAGLKLGCVLISQEGPPAKDLIAQGKTLKDSGFYDWIFVDGALTRADIQEIIDGLAGVGWTKIMVNDTGFPNGQNVVSDPPKRVLGHAKAFGAVNNPDGPAITDNDKNFIDWIRKNRPEGVPILKLEIDSGIQKFLALPVATQKRLLNEWSKAQATSGFQMIYPLFTTTYDSMAEGTYDTQLNLMK